MTLSSVHSGDLQLDAEPVLFLLCSATEIRLRSVAMLVVDVSLA